MFEKGELHRKLPFMLSSLMWEKSTLADSACRTGISTSSAVHARICIDYVMIISSEITYAIVISSFNLFSSLMITDHRVNRNPFWDMSLF